VTFVMTFVATFDKDKKAKFQLFVL